MTVRELIVELLGTDMDRLVVLAADAEGNGYAVLATAGEAAFRPSGRGDLRGDVGLDELTPELERRGFTEDDVMVDGRPCVVLRPF